MTNPSDKLELPNYLRFDIVDMFSDRFFNPSYNEADQVNSLETLKTLSLPVIDELSFEDITLMSSLFVQPVSILQDPIILGYDGSSSIYTDGRGIHMLFSRGLALKFAEHDGRNHTCLLYTSPSPRDATLSRMPSSA